MKILNRSAITIYGTEKFLDWVKENHPNLHHWTLKDLNHHPNMYLVDVEDQNCWGDCFSQNFQAIFKNEVGEYIHDGVDWPQEITLELYRSWFAFEYTEYVYDLSENNIKMFDE